MRFVGENNARGVYIRLVQSKIFLVKTYISQGSVATGLRYGGKFSDCLIANLLDNAHGEIFLKLTSTWTRVWCIIFSDSGCIYIRPTSILTQYNVV